MAPLEIVATPFFEPAGDHLRFLPEGPRLLQNHPDGDGKLGWVAIQHGPAATTGSINVLDLSTKANRSFPLPGRPGFFAETTRPGMLIVGIERRLAYFDLTTGEFQNGPEVTEDERVLINDGLAVEGGVLFGTKDLEFTRPIAAVYFFDAATRQVHRVFNQQICSNGKSLRRHDTGATLIDIDSIPGTISRYRLDARLKTVLDTSIIQTLDFRPGLPDGMRPFAPIAGQPEDESIVVAYYNPKPVSHGAARQIRLADGAILCEWRIPGSPRVTCPEFVEIGGEVKLVFTTAVEGMSAEERHAAPGAGALYLADLPSPLRTLPTPPPLVPYD